MNNKQQFKFICKASYMAPSMKSVKLHIRQSILTGSNDSPLYGGSNKPGGDIDDDDDYTYNF